MTTIMFRCGRLAAIAAWVAHALAWAAGLYLAIGPVYQGVSMTAAAPGELPGEVNTHTATLIEVNGLYVVPLLLIPVLLTALGLLTIYFIAPGRAVRKALLWLSAVALAAYCIVAIFSLGVFYLPAALVVLCTAILSLPERGSPTNRQAAPRE
jgi:hypothetical protein